METKDLEKRITSIFYEDGEDIYGARRVYQILCMKLSKLEEKRICCIKRVQKIMHRLGLVSCHRAKYKPTPSQQKIEESHNLLNQDVNTTNLNQKWVTDSTYILTKKDAYSFGVKHFRRGSIEANV